MTWLDLFWGRGTLVPYFWPYVLGIFPEIQAWKIGLTYGMYLQFRFLNYPLTTKFDPQEALHVAKDAFFFSADNGVGFTYNLTEPSRLGDNWRLSMVKISSNWGWSALNCWDVRKMETGWWFGTWCLWLSICWECHDINRFNLGNMNEHQKNT